MKNWDVGVWLEKGQLEVEGGGEEEEEVVVVAHWWTERRKAEVTAVLTSWRVAFVDARNAFFSFSVAKAREMDEVVMFGWRGGKNFE